ncbi:hypothetical protein SLE2022_127840 [Rubroshorea leprosula]
MPVAPILHPLLIAARSCTPAPPARCTRKKKRREIRKSSPPACCTDPALLRTPTLHRSCTPTLHRSCTPCLLQPDSAPLYAPCLLHPILHLCTLYLLQPTLHPSSAIDFAPLLCNQIMCPAPASCFTAPLQPVLRMLCPFVTS